MAYRGGEERPENVSDGTAGMNADGKSDEPIVPATSANKGSAELPAESGEGSGSTKRNAGQAALSRTQCRTKSKPRGLVGVREAVEANTADPHARITSGFAFDSR